MDPSSRRASLQALLHDINDAIRHLEAHETKLMGHGESRDRAKALSQAKGALRRLDKSRRHVERQLRVGA